MLKKVFFLVIFFLVLTKWVQIVEAQTPASCLNGCKYEISGDTVRAINCSGYTFRGLVFQCNGPLSLGEGGRCEDKGVHPGFEKIISDQTGVSNVSLGTPPLCKSRQADLTVVGRPPGDTICPPENPSCSDALPCGGSANYVTGEGDQSDCQAPTPTTKPIMSPTPTPLPPSLSASISCSPRRINLSWTFSAATDDFHVRRCEGTNCNPLLTGVLLTKVPKTQFSYQDTTVLNGVIYRYVVRSHVHATGVFRNSNIIQKTINCSISATIGPAITDTPTPTRTPTPTPIPPAACESVTISKTGGSPGTTIRLGDTLEFKAVGTSPVIPIKSIRMILKISNRVKLDVYVPAVRNGTQYTATYSNYQVDETGNFQISTEVITQ